VTTPLFVWLRAQSEHQLSAIHDVSVRDPGAVERLAVQRRRLHINVRRRIARSFHGERLAAL
jgi:hypothetical protein